MKILPDYLIQYMPEIEEAIEELRLSVIDHAYEMLQCLDVDELTSDEIRHKLGLYDVKVENMSNEWLPNGRFYRLYPYIKHHRTRLNTLKAISTSGGQFEGLWSNDYNNKTTYNYNLIQVMRHYDLKSPLDGYFYVSGNVDRDATNTVNSSVVVALDSDILMSQALPAGYTYLYIPWPRPSYPSDAGYFYQVHMLDYDRLAYTRLCDKIEGWVLDERTGNYVNNTNKVNQIYSPITCKYKQFGTDQDNPWHYFDCSSSDDCLNDVPFPSDKYPASMKYDWYNGKGTPWRTPYWFDYHYMNDVKPSQKDVNTLGIRDINNSDNIINVNVNDTTLTTWPITEYGRYVYYDEYGSEVEVTDPSEATAYKLYVECEKLADTKSVFPTNCYLHTRNKTTPTNREVGIKYAYNEYQIKINSAPDPIKLDSITQIILNETYLDVYTISDRLNHTPCILCSYLDKVKANYIVNLINAVDNIAEVIAMVDPENDVFNEYSMDEFYDKSERDSYAFGPLRNDVLLKNTLVIKECLNHIKTYKPFWCESIPTLDTSESRYNSGLNPDKPASHSFYYWFKLKQSNNRPEVAINNTYDTGFIRDNKPPVSEETFTSYTQPTVTRSEKIYVGFLTDGNSDQYDNHTLSNTTIDNEMYGFGELSAIKYDPSLNYNIISLNHNDSGDQIEITEDIDAYIEGDPYDKKLYINRNGDTNNSGSHNYVMYKTSEVHQLYFTNTFEDVSLSSTYSLCNKHEIDNEIFYFTYNGVKFIITMVALLNEDGERVDYDNGNLYVMVKDSKYYVKNTPFTKWINGIATPVTAASALFTLKVVPGQATEEAEVTINVGAVYNSISTADEEANLGLVGYTTDSLAPLVFVDKYTGAITGRAYPESEGVIFAGATGQFTVTDMIEIVWAELNPPPAGSVDFVIYFNGDHAPVIFAENEVVLKVKWGDTVNVPAGYTVSEVRTFVGYAFKSYYNDSVQDSKTVAYSGKDEYFNNISDHDLIQQSTYILTSSYWPLLVPSQGYSINNAAGPHMQVLDFGAGHTDSSAYCSLYEKLTNGTDSTAGNYSVYLRLPNSPQSVPNAIESGYPVRYLWFTWDDSSNSAVWHKSPEAFKVPQSLWSFSNGTFSWLGNSEDTSSLAWYYKHDWELFEWSEFDGVWFYVHCIKEE